MTPAPPAQGTLERWAWDYLHAQSLHEKLAPLPAPRRFEIAPPPRRVAQPGRPPELKPSERRFKTPRPGALQTPERRAELVHTFLHHELQAAELMCWAILAFPSTPEPFRAGLAGITRDEIRHMDMYARYLETLGHRYGDYPVRDWFWERIPSAPSPAHFVATLGLGFEGANLDHTARFAERFLAAGDPEGAELQRIVGAEEIAHVRFALHWFREWTGREDFSTWVNHLPPPLSPMVMRGVPLDRESRAHAGFSDAFIDELSRWSPSAPGF